MNSGVVDAAYRATHEVELPVSELRTLEQGVADLAAAFVAQIMYLKRELTRKDIHIDLLEERLKAYGELTTDDEMDDVRASAAAMAEHKREVA
jgi:hypothetical protein